MGQLSDWDGVTIVVALSLAMLGNRYASIGHLVFSFFLRPTGMMTMIPSIILQLRTVFRR